MLLETLLTICTLIGGPQNPNRWWGMQLAGQPVGYYHETVRTIPNGHIVTTTEMKMVINRLGHKVEFDTASEAEETAEGELQSIHSTTRSSDQVMKLSAERKGSSLEILTETGGKSYVHSVSITGTLSGPAGLNHRSLQGLKKPGDQVVCSIFMPELGAVATEKRTFLATQQTPGKPVRKIEDEIEGVPGKQSLLIASDGTIVERRQPFPFGELRLFSTDRLAAQAMSAGGTLPADMYDRTLVRANVRLPDPRSMDRIKLRITHKHPELGWPDLSGENQQVLERTPDTMVIEVRRPKLSGLIAAAEPTVIDTEYRDPNAMIQSDDPLIARLAREVPGENKGYQAARDLQDWVAAHMKLDLGILFAPASEVVRNRRGTCVAYSVLLCALERAAGLAARVAWGFVYEEGIWGGHAWTEIKVGDRWIPIDAAMYSPGPADAARFRFAVSSLQNGPGDLTEAGMRLYGNIAVQIIEYTVNGRTVNVPDHAKPYQIKGDTYANPWLHTAITKPHGWRFTTLNAVFPDPTIVAMENAKGAAVRLQTASLGGGRAEIEKVFAGANLPPGCREIRCAGRRAYRVDTPTKAMIVAPADGTAWILLAQGKNASLMLNKVMSTWSLQ